MTAQTAHAGSVVSFPQTAVGVASTAVSVTFTFDSSTSIAVPAVLTQGATGLDYVDAGGGSCTAGANTVVYQVGQTCTVNVAFTPEVPGQRLGAVQLTTTSGAVVATALINGIGTGPYLTFGTRIPTTTVTSIPSKNDVQLEGLATDGKGDVFFPDSVNGAIREVVATNGLVSSASPVVFVGSGLTDPQGLAVDGAGDIFLIDNNAVKEIVAVNGVLSPTSQILTLTAGYNQLVGVAVDASGNLYFTDSGTYTIYEMAATNGAVSAASPVSAIYSPLYVAGDGVAGLRVDSMGNIFFQPTYDGGGAQPDEIIAINGAVSPFSDVTGVTIVLSTNDFALDAADNAYTSSIGYGTVSGNQLNESMVVNAPSTSVPGVNMISGEAYDGYGHLYQLLLSTKGEMVLVRTDLRALPTLSFPTTAPGSTSTALVELQNSGTAPLTFQVPSTGTNPMIATPFSLGKDPSFVVLQYGPTPVPECVQLTPGSTSVSLAPGNMCYEYVTFAAPAAAGSVSGQLLNIDNDQGAPAAGYVTQTIPLNASVGSAISVAVNPVSVPSGSTATTFTAIVTYGGAAPTGAVSFTIDGASIGVGSCTATSSTVETCTLGYNPSGLSVGTHTLLATVATDTNYLQTASTITHNLTVTAAAVATTQTTTAFPDTPFGSTSAPVPVTFTFQTAGTMATPQVFTTGATGLDFTDASTGTCTTNGTSHMYAPGDTCTVNVVFQPTAVGYRLGSVVLNASGQKRASVTNLVGNATGPWLLYTGSPIYSGVPSSTTIASFAEGAGASDSGMVIDGKGDLYFSDVNTNTINMLAATNGVIAPGTPITTLLSGFVSPRAMAIDGSGNLYVMDSGAGAVEEFLATNGVVSSSSTMVTLQDGLYGALGVGVDQNGNVFYMATTGNFTFALYELPAVNGVVPPNSTPTVIASNVIIGFYSGIANNIRVDGAGNLYLMTNSGMIRYNATNGSVQPGASTYIYPVSDVFGGAGFNDAVIMPSGDLFVANNPSFFHYNSGLGPDQENEVPLGEVFTISALVTDGRGHIYAEVAATDNSVNPPSGPANTVAIEELDFTAPPTLTFAPTQVGSTSAAQSFVIQNEGNQTLYMNDTSAGLIGVISSGFNPTTICYGATVVTTPQYVPAGIGCNMSVALSPVAGQLGTVNGTFTLADNSLNVTNASQTIPLVGTATSAAAPAPTVTVATNHGAGVNQPVTLLASVTSSTTGTINGTVTFYDNGVALANGSAPLITGSASVAVAPLSVGTHPITATFSPTGSTFAASTSAVSPLIIYPNTGTIYFGNTSFVYDGTPHGVTATTVPAGLAYSVTYEGSPTPPTAAGSYRVVATITDPDYTGTATGTLIISQTATNATVTLGNLNVTYDGTSHLPTVMTTPAGLQTVLTVNGFLISTNQPAGQHNAGYYPVTANIISPGYTGYATGEFIIARAPATVTLSGLNQPYTGSPIYVTVTAVPAGLSYSVTYNGATVAPTQPGTYSVVATVIDNNYSGTATGTLTISNDIPATITLGGGQFQQYTGSPLSLTATTNPAGLSVALTYNGSPTPPTNAGYYPVVATITTPGYYGTATSYLDIFAAPASVSLGNLNQVYTGSPLAPSVTTSPPGLTVSFGYFNPVNNSAVPPPTDPGSYTVIGTITGPNYYGSASGTLTITPGSVAGAVFVAGSNGVGALTASGGVLSPTTAGGGIGEAVDASGNVWSIDAAGGSVAEFMPNGTLSTDYANVGLTGATALAIDGYNNLWVANGNGTLAVLSTTGTAVSAATGSTNVGGSSVVIDNSGNVWVTNTAANTVDEVIGVAAPVAPLANAVQSNTLGGRP